MKNKSGKGKEITPTRFYQKLSTMPNNIHQHNVETIKEGVMIILKLLEGMEGNIC